jgi:hypothetical protein
MTKARHRHDEKKARTIVSLIGPSFFNALFHAGFNDPSPTSFAWKQVPRPKGEQKQCDAT